MQTDTYDSLAGLFPAILSERVKPALKSYGDMLTEIRIRIGKPVIYMQGIQEHVDVNFIPEEVDMQELFLHICKYSVYAYEGELRKGYITTEGGHRVGICGYAVMDDVGNIQSYRYITSFNIRVAHEITGIAETIVPYLYEQKRFLNTLIVSAPGCGKTTLLRDLIRSVSNGNNYGEGRSVSVVDERLEIGAIWAGKLQHDLGMRTDVLSECAKPVGISMILRTMGPRIIAVDEVGSREDIEWLRRASDSGCGILATIHGDDIEKVINNKDYDLITKQIITRYVLLSDEMGPGTLVGIYDGEGGICYIPQPC